MKFGFALFQYFPFGGLQRDMLAIADACHQRGHEVLVFTRYWKGERPAFVEVHELPVRGLTNHRRDSAFARQLPSACVDVGVERVVGFNKMPGLDVYYAADSCFAAKVYEQRSPLYRFTARARHHLAMEETVFGKRSATQILLISEPEKPAYRRYYGTDESRLHLLPPGIRRDRIMPADYGERRAAFRAAQGWGDESVILFVGSGFRTKGLDRAIEALARLPAAQRGRSRLLVLGQDGQRPFEKQARRLGVAERVEFRGGVGNVADYLWAADALLHPAYRENTGTVLLEAMVAGLPVVTTAACGYAAWVEQGAMGRVLDEPAGGESIAQALSDVLAAQPGRWRERGAAFAAESNIFSMPECAADIIIGTSAGVGGGRE